MAMANDPAKPRRQYGAIPMRRTMDGGLQVLLLTSRETHRWVIPKGWPMAGRKGPEVAAQEAFEEAGVRGRITGGRIGSYMYQKRLSPSKAVVCKVAVYRFKVTCELEDWPERPERERRWFPVSEAAALVAEAELADMFTRLAQSARCAPPERVPA
jgi:8-oxo-dGTP pyrophosphatase MutT (NUDIX family)